MNRLEYLARHGDPEEIVNEVMLEISAWRKSTDILKSDLAERDKEIERLQRACAVLYFGSPELHHVAENAYSGCASTQRDDPYELRKALEAGR